MSKLQRNNPAYWRLREAEAKRRYLKEEVAYNRELEKIYLNVYKSIEKEINSFYSRYAEKEGISLAEAKKRANQLDMDYYSNKAKEYVKNRNFSEKANAEMCFYNLTMKANRLELLKANIGLENVAGFNRFESLMDKGLNKRTLDEMTRQAGILGKTVGNNKKLAKEIVNASFKNATFSDRIWMHQSLLKNKLDILLQNGLIRGLNPKELAQGLDKIFSVSKRDALRLMQTELCRVQTSAQKSSYEANGYEYFEFIGDQSGACEICRSLDGKRFKVKDMLVGENAPPVHPHCRCSTSAAESISEREIVDKLIKEANINDKVITPALKNIAEKNTVSLKGLDFRIKSEDSLIRKLISKAKQHNISVQDYSKRITDVLRYTIVSRDDDFTQKYISIVDDLAQKGYNTIEVTNTLKDRNAIYRGVNTLVKTNSGFVFELQYHTKKSIEIKEKNHKLYEECRMDGISEERKNELKHEMIENSKGVLKPKDIFKIKNLLR